MTPEQQLAPLLLEWWREHGRRHLPWQQDPTPYRVWVSEIMLQQTQVPTVERYYPRFMRSFPDAVSLADAAQDDVLHHWSGLGYYARARNLHRAAQVVRDEYGGQVPEDFDALNALPGIGRSTAGAILALSRNQRHPILDGNVKRVIARVFEVAGWPGRSAVARELWQLADRCTPADRAASYTQAIMDLGATLCTRSRPDCGRCPLRALCGARASGNQAGYPGRAPKRKRPNRQTAVILCLRHDGRVLLEKRPSDGIWGGLWGLPEADSVDSAARFGERQLGTRPERVEIRDAVSHAFTHFELQMTPVLLHLPATQHAVMEEARWLWYNLRDPARVGMAAPVSRLLESLGEEL